MSDLEMVDYKFCRSPKAAAAEITRLRKMNAELLEALKTLLDRVDQINMTTSQIQYWADYQALARAAIAKATGDDAQPVGESQ